MTVESVDTQKSAIKIKGQLTKDLEKGWVVECVSRNPNEIQLRTTTSTTSFDRSFLIQVTNPIFEAGDTIIINEYQTLKVEDVIQGDIILTEPLEDALLKGATVRIIKRERIQKQID